MTYRSNMKLVFLFGLIAFAGSGCSTADFKTGLAEKFTGPKYRSEVVAAEQPAAFEVARSALEQMGFVFTKSGAAQGILEGHAGLVADESLRGSRQRLVSVRFSGAPGGTEVAVLFSEVVEDDFSKGSGTGTQAPLRDTPLYEVFFRNLAAGLGLARP